MMLKDGRLHIIIDVVLKDVRERLKGDLVCVMVTRGKERCYSLVKIIGNFFQLEGERGG